MDVFQLALAFILTSLPVWVCLSRMVPADVPARIPLILGYSLFLGMIGVTLIMRLHHLFGVTFSFLWIGITLVAVALFACCIPRSETSPRVSYPARAGLTRLAKLVLLLCLCLIGVRLITLGLESATRPIFPWDAKQHWAKQAKVFVEHGSVVSHVGSLEWQLRFGEGVYASLHPNYPATVPLIQTWIAVVLDRWHDSLVNIPWIVCLISLCLMFYAQARVAGSSLLLSVAGTYMLLSMPLLNTHIALAGYADAFLATGFVAALAAFYNWSVTRQHWQGGLLLAAAVSCMMVKNEGLFWALSLVPGFIIVYLGIRRSILLIGLAGLVVLLLLQLLPENFSLAGHKLGDLSLKFRPEGIEPVLRGFFVNDNWHLLFYLFILGSIALVATAREHVPRVLPMLASVLAALGLYLVLYLFTQYSFAAIEQTSANRVALHLAPAVAFAVLMLFSTLCGEFTRPSRKGED